ncbi:uncharacterized protein LOC131883557 [Tigriopus californicus]|uniref:uncharacterized protein LOC131883557 n=1 Tax=Tigriopus californicus TaxID=6832 RepID=UPI0027DA1AD9|nr:uncharacterized protein LOC131883557 [Tigriopus californicus]
MEAKFERHFAPYVILVLSFWITASWAQETLKPSSTQNAQISDSDTISDPPHHVILCRHCGRDTADPSYLVTHQAYLSSPFDHFGHQKNYSSIFGQENIPLQRLINPSGAEFDVVILKKAGCSGQAQWSSQATWFPGYSWRVCVCPQCKSHLGWMFEPTEVVQDVLDKPSDQGFYALIADKLIDEAYASTLLTKSHSLKN